ncbi:hypothetical protein C8R47DRAFT_320711 [Mycena vitilis]|nr:hypothetical protein C8R47DRAFT_320711 [Mycena vitilis]
MSPTTRGQVRELQALQAETELTEERELAQISASRSGSSPLESGGGTDLGHDKATRADVETLLAEEIHDRRSKSGDLVESIFGLLIDTDDAADIVLELLQMSILSVQIEKDGQLQEVLAEVDRRTACANAVKYARAALAPSKSSPTDSYKWKWALEVEASETAAALFLNVVAIAAHAATIRIGKVDNPPLPSLRFVTLPNPHRGVPLSNESASQDCRPDVVALDLTAFCGGPSPDAPDDFFLLRDSPFDYIRNHIPSVLTFTADHRSKNSKAVDDFLEWFDQQARSNYLRMSQFCWPEIQLTAEARLLDISNAILQQLVYMRQQRRTQPWMRSVIGLVLTTKIMGVLRADALGIEQCIFDRDCGRGVLDSVRICLGLVRATCHERGQHEAFELAQTTTMGAPHLKSEKSSKAKADASTPKTTKKPGRKPNPKPNTADEPITDVFADPKVEENPQMEYIHRTVRFITLFGDRIHYTPDGTKPDVRFYVHHLVQDHGSLVGRCARVFCVSRETDGKDGVRHFIGPYALKVYNASHASDCFRDNLIGVAREARLKNVLLPTWEWYYGDALTMRGFAHDVVESYSLSPPVAVVPNVLSNREEIFAQTDLKRLLIQCSGYEEFEQSFLDYTDAIFELAEKQLVHRDVSIGNVLLRQDTPCSSEFLSYAGACAAKILGVPVVFIQRPLDEKMGGLLHDMDMSGHLRDVPQQALEEKFENKDGGQDDLADSEDEMSDRDVDETDEQDPNDGEEEITSGYEGVVVEEARDEDNDAPSTPLEDGDAPNTPVELNGPVEAQKEFGFGTPPFMAVSLMIVGPPHLVEHDSFLCYVSIFL